VEGEATHRNSPQVRDFTRERIESGTINFVVDLENCPGMDSTFMGVLTATALEVRRCEEPGHLEIINANERNTQSLKKLGLQCVLDLDEDGSAWKDEKELVAMNVAKPLPTSDIDPRSRTELVLEAHEALVKANAENCSRFQDVLDYLRQDLKQKSPQV
jgi:anti-anti-sigma regulatory factor